jgi:hypothetical protein
MSKRLLVSLLAVLLVAGVSLAGEKSKEASDSWTGWITDTMCGAKGEKAAHADCATKCVKEMGAKWALYNSSDGKLYVLEPQDKAAGHAGQHVKVKGTVEGNTIKLVAIEPTGEQKGKEKEKSSY